MRFDILILTMPTREKFLERLLECLSPQVDHKNSSIMIRMCDPELTLGENRDIMRRESTATYSAFVDDDDLVSPDYVSQILPLCDGVDQIGFECEVWQDGVKMPQRDFHTLTAGAWIDTEHAFLRDISHLQPMRRELALSEPMEGGHGEDRRWADRMRGKVKTEHYIDKVLYFYLFRSRKQLSVPCIYCKSTRTVQVEKGSFCNVCGRDFNPLHPRKSCLWT